MAGTDIPTGVTTPHGDVVQALDATMSPAVARLPVTAGQLDPVTDQMPQRDLTGERLADLAVMEADCRAAQAAGMSAEDDRRDHYQGQALPLGGRIGDTMTLPMSPLDPGVGSTGTTDPSGAFYDPPRGGAPETFVTPASAEAPFLYNTGNQPK